MDPCKLSLELKNAQTETEKLCRCINDLGRSLGLDKKTTFSISLSIEELFTNIVSYGFPDNGDHLICIDITEENGVLVIRIEDDGVPFDPARAERPDVKCPLENSKVGGLGILLARKMMDQFRYERRKDKNIITMKKFLSKG